MTEREPEKENAHQIAASNLCSGPADRAHVSLTQTFAEKYRPARFGDVIGQNAAIVGLTGSLRNQESRHFILSGPRGSGKTTIARILAKVLNCAAFAPAADGALSATAGSIEPCGTCHSCRTIHDEDQHDAFHPINGSGDKGRKERLIRLFNETLSYFPLYGRRHVVFIDEAKALSSSAQEFLLTELTDKPDITVIFGLIDASGLLPTLRERCREVVLRPSDAAHRRTYLDRICCGEGWPADPRALELIAERYTNFRTAEDALAKVRNAAGGELINESLVQGELIRPQAEPTVQFLKALATGRLQDQLDAVRAASGTPAAKVLAIQSLLLFLKVAYVGPTMLRPDRDAEMLYDPDSCRAIAEGFRIIASRFEKPLAAWYDELLEHWQFMPLVINDVVLEQHVIRCNDMVSAALATTSVEAAPLPPSRPAFMSSRGRRRPSVRRRLLANAPTPSEVFIDYQQAADIYEGATFLLQEHGVAFNARLTVPLSGEQPAGAQAPNILGELCRTLAPRLNVRGHCFHRIAAYHRTPAGLQGTLIFHHPQDLNFDVFEWCLNFLAGKRWAKGDEVAVLRPPLRNAEPRRLISQHWTLMRSLWAGVDPSLLVGSKRLIDLLGLPAREQRPAGVISGRRFDFSQSIGPKSQKAAAAEGMGHLSALNHDRWDIMFTGWELIENKERVEERSRRVRSQAELQARVADAGDPALKTAAEHRLRQEQRSWLVTPEHRTRRRACWVSTLNSKGSV